MATVSEIHSLEDINYKSRIKVYFYPLIVLGVFIFAFLNYYPIGDEMKAFMKKNLKGSACNPDYDQIRIEWFMPKLVITDLTLPAGCFNRVGEPVKFSFVNVNFNFISFAPFGIPFKIETEMNSQPLTVYFVQGIGSRTIRMKDQPIVMSRIQPLLGGKFKMSGTVTVDLNATMANNNNLTALAFKARSRDFQIPPQNIEGFTTPSMKVNTFYVEANSTNPPRVSVDKMIIGDPEAPMRANFKGRIDLQQGAMGFSPIDLTGEIGFSENFKQTVPLVDLLFQSYTQKDGFYQIRVGGTLGQPKLSNP